MRTDLDAVVKALLESRRGDWLAIAKQSGVSHSWMSKLARGLIPNPGIVTLRKLYQALKG